MNRRVVITGIGVVSPLGIGAKAHWAALCAGTVGVSRITAFDPAGFASQVGGQAPAFKIGDYVPKSYRKATKVMARDIELAVVAADDAVKDAGLKTKAYTDKPDVDGTRFGCNIGAGLISVDLNELTSAMASANDGDRLDLAKWGQAGMQQLTPLWLLKYLPNMLACHVTIIHELKGPSNTITCGDASSHLAIGEAFRTIQRGDADLAICGGAETKVQPMGLIRQCLLEPRFATDAQRRPGHGRPPVRRGGRRHGRRRGRRAVHPRGVRPGRRPAGPTSTPRSSASGPPRTRTGSPSPTPRGGSYARAVQQGAGRRQPAAGGRRPARPLRRSASPAHDRAELNGLTHRLRRRFVPHPRQSTPKAQTGNMAAGSGVDAAAAVLAVKHDKVPPAVNTPRPRGGLNVSPTVRDRPVNVAVSSVYSLGGQNAALVFRKV